MSHFANRKALRFILILGIVSLLADATYEGARGITGPYMAILGASAAVVATVSGLGELIGYGLRLAFGYLSDRTGRYWTLTLLGYAINVLAVPLLALAGRWEVAALLIVAERLGKAIRTPARDAMLSYATKQVGRGWGFGLHEAMDQIGALLGPAIVAAVLFSRSSYPLAFGVLLLPALLALLALGTARFLYPRPQDLEPTALVLQTKGFPRAFWVYLAAVCLVAAGYADFPLIAYHCKRTSLVGDGWIPVLYAMAMGVDAVAAVLFGRWFDRAGLKILAGVSIVSALFAPLVFLGNLPMVIAGVALWGIGMGAQESIVRAAVADMVPSTRRGTAYGLFNTGYGISWFLGSVLLGALYGVSLQSLALVSAVFQIAAVPIFLMVGKLVTRTQRVG
ncbi:MAG: MFS transporter [candidate division KSB1 bacterium]|nr:MFS transporter [candidate division KSB1 bacterium]